MLKETDGIIALPTYDSIEDCYNKTNGEIKKQLNEISALIKKDYTLSPLYRGNNVFWNVVSVCSICHWPVHISIINDFALRNYDLCECRMDGAVLVGADLSGAKLRNAHFNKANLSKAYLHGADLFCADFSEANLEETCLQRAFLFGSNMRKAHLIKANLRWADISMSCFEKANLEKADLCWAYIAGAKITDAILKGVIINSTEIETWKALGTDVSVMRFNR